VANYLRDIANPELVLVTKGLEVLTRFERPA